MADFLFTFAREMPIRVFKKFIDYPKQKLPDGRLVSIVKKGLGKTRRVPFDIYTLEEAREKERLGEIEIVEDWREHFFVAHENLTGKYVLTDDDPPKVTPVVNCWFHQKPHRKRPSWVCPIVFPWTQMLSPRRKLLFGIKARSGGVELKRKLGRARLDYIKLFILLSVLGMEPKKIVQIIWGIKSEVEQEAFVRLILVSETGQEAVKSLAEEVLSDVGLSPRGIAKKLKEIFESDKTPVDIRVSGYQNLLDRIPGMCVKKEEQNQKLIGFYGQGYLPSPSESEDQGAARIIQEEAARLGKALPSEKASKIKDLQSEEAPEGGT